MRLRTKLFLLFSLLSLLLVALAGVITYWLTSSALISELDEQTDQAAGRVRAYIDIRGVAAADAVGSLSQRPALRRTLALVSSGIAESRSPEIVALAEKSVVGTDLDVLEILDGEGTVLSSAHWKANYGASSVEALSLARAADGAATTAMIDVRGHRRVSLVSLISLEIGEESFLLMGGYFMDADALRELSELLDVDVMLLPLNPRDETGVEGATAGAEGSSVSISTHVLREVYLPHAGPEPVAKLVVGVSRARLERLTDSLRRAFFVAALAALLLSWIAALALARGMTRPIEKLTAGAHRVASGDLTAPVSGEGQDELGLLVASFNRMLVDLKESRTTSARMERIAAWREVARRIAHEIMNALSPIQLSIENVQRSYEKGTVDFDRVLARATKTVREEVEGLRGMVDEFSSLARMPAPTLIRHDVRQVAERVVSLHEGTRPDVSLTLETPESAVYAEVDPQQLARALGNIVSNAIDACPDGGRVSVSVVPPAPDSEPGKGRVRIAVRDTGKGLTSEQLERIFEPYYTTKEDGTGLGLAIVMKIVTDHGGTVEVDVEQTAGSTFTILLPSIVET